MITRRGLNEIPYARHHYRAINPPPLAEMMGIEAAKGHLGLDVTAKAQLEADARSQGDLLPHMAGNMNWNAKVSNCSLGKYI